MGKKHRNNTPVGRKQDVVTHTRQEVRQELFSGPLPPPEILEKYDQILPGAAERIIGMAESQTNHRQGIETKVINSDVRNSQLGLWFGFIIGMTAILASCYLVLNDQTSAGSLLGLGALASLVGVFVYGSRQRRLERTQRNPQQ